LLDTLLSVTITMTFTGKTTVAFTGNITNNTNTNTRTRAPRMCDRGSARIAHGRSPSLSSVHQPPQPHSSITRFAAADLSQLASHAG
jgi:hypothetical protein